MYNLFFIFYPTYNDYSTEPHLQRQIPVPLGCVVSACCIDFWTPHLSCFQSESPGMGFELGCESFKDSLSF